MPQPSQASGPGAVSQWDSGAHLKKLSQSTQPEDRIRLFSHFLFYDFVVLAMGTPCILTQKKLVTSGGARIPSSTVIPRARNDKKKCEDHCRNQQTCQGYSMNKKGRCALHLEGPLEADLRGGPPSWDLKDGLCAVKQPPYKLHTFMQCDAHHMDAQLISGAGGLTPAQECYLNKNCVGLYNPTCNGYMFHMCTRNFTMLPDRTSANAVNPPPKWPPINGGCTYTKPTWSPVSYLKSPTGCKCYFDETRTDCACCHRGSCQCSQSIGPDRCAPCDAMYKCIVSEDLYDFPDLTQVVSTGLLVILNDILEATTYEVKQSGIRAFLKEAYELPSSQAKVQAVALLDAKLNKDRGQSSSFEFPNADQVEEWLSSWFLHDEVFKHSKDIQSVKGDAEIGNRPSVIKGLVSRGAFIQDKLQKCNWRDALQQFFATGGSYGNWCGKSPPGTKKMKSTDVCKDKMSKDGKWGYKVCADSGFDESCSRHDLGAYSTDLYGIAQQSLCKVDADFKATRVKLDLQSRFRDNLQREEAKSVSAANCLFDMMPCLRYERREVWDWCPSWSGGYPCLKSIVGYHTHWPFGNYSKFEDDACGPTGCYWEDDVIAQ